MQSSCNGRADHHVHGELKGWQALPDPQAGPAPGLSISVHLLAFACLIAAPPAIVGSIAAFRYAQVQQHEVEQTTERQVATLKLAIERYLEGTRGALDALAAGVDPGDLKSTYDRALTLLPQYGTAISIRDASGQQLLNTRAPWGAPLPVTGASAVRDSDARAVATGRVTYSSVYTGTVDARPYVLVDRPLAGGAGRPLAINIAIAADDLRDRVMKDMPAEWMGAILDHERRIIARFRDQDKYAGVAASAEVRHAIRDDAGGSLVTTTFDGLRVWTSYAPIADTGWFAVVSVPLSLLQAPIHQLWWTLSLLALATGGLSVAAATLYSRMIVRSASILRRDADRLAAEERVEIENLHIAELNQVHASMAQASRKLRERSHELTHRVKNTLAILQSLAKHTVRSHGGTPALGQTLTGRIAALSVAHDALTDANWTETSLCALLEAIASSQSIRLTCEGPDVRLRNSAVVAIAQLAQELVQNARRYGSLTHGSGRIEVAWTTSGDEIVLDWREPAPLGEAPGLDRFGASVIALCVERHLNGTYGSGRTVQGWHFQMRFPLISAVASNARVGT